MSLESVKKRVRYGGALVRVKPEVEELVIKLSEELGCPRDRVRNTAILLGITLIKSGFEIPKDDVELIKLVRVTKTFIELVDGLVRGVSSEGMKH